MIPVEILTAIFLGLGACAVYLVGVAVGHRIEQRRIKAAENWRAFKSVIRKAGD
jgi:hypothetical protein